MVKKTDDGRKRGKKYIEVAALITEDSYSVKDATELLTKLNTTSFDPTAEVHIRIDADTTQADQLVRTTVTLPNGTGQNIRIAAFVTDDHIDEAKKAGADKAGNDDLIKEIEGGKIDFDIAVAMPDVMKDLAKIAKTLGQKGLMPNPKAGTVTSDIAKTIKELKKGRIECKMDTQGIIHAVFGKLSFGGAKLAENLETLIGAIKEAQPTGIKGAYILSVSISPSMGPAVKVAV